MTALVCSFKRTNQTLNRDTGYSFIKYVIVVTLHVYMCKMGWDKDGRGGGVC